MAFMLLINNARELWKEWEVRLIVLISLVIQTMLMLLGSWRKTAHRSSILPGVVWFMYLIADPLATTGIAVLSSRMASFVNNKNVWLDPKSQLIAFWAPFLLVHLGGPDTITAYSLADNELWLRHFFRFCFQVTLVCYVYFLALTRSPLSVLAAAVFVVGLIKYGERILSLYWASPGPRRDSMLSSSTFQFRPIYPRLMEQNNLRVKEGYKVKKHEVIEVQAPEDQSPPSGDDEFDENLKHATALFEVFKRLFVDLILDRIELTTSRSWLEKMRSDNAFSVVEIELGYMYDMLYTKGMLLYSWWGVVRRSVTLVLTLGVFVTFSLQEKSSYSKTDVTVTYFLIYVAMLSEIYTLLLAVSSDQVRAWLLKRPQRSPLSLSIWLTKSFRRRRWSNTIAQLSLLGLSIKRRRIFHNHLPPKLARYYMKAEKYLFIWQKDLKGSVKDWIFKNLNEKAKEIEERTKLGKQRYIKKVNCEYNATEKLKKAGCYSITPSTEEVDFDQSILIWQIVTEICYYGDRRKMQGQNSEAMKNYKMSKLVSRYMLFLLNMHPSMLPTGIGVHQYEDTFIDAQKFFQDKTLIAPKKEGHISLRQIFKWVSSRFTKRGRHEHRENNGCGLPHKSRRSRDLCEACHQLLKVHTKRTPHLGESRSLLFDACEVLSKLNEHTQEEAGGSSEEEALLNKWKLISDIWADALLHAACESKGEEHARSLSRGGELLSHVWLLMAHFGISAQATTSSGRSISKLVLD